MLIAQGFGPRMELAPGYVAVLRQAVSNLNNDPDQGQPGDQRKRAALI
jgi:hypothetical protein